MRGSSPSLSAERGAVIIFVSFALLVLIAFCAFAVDAGILWVARRQAQNAADAGAFAGAIALAFDDYTNRDDDGPAKQSALTLAQANNVWLEPPDVQITTDITFPPVPEDWCEPWASGLSPCVRVDAYRNQARANPLPTFFARLVGITDQGVRATATAVATPANASHCLKPWAVMDKWIEKYPVETEWTPDVTFDKYDRWGNPLNPQDIYEPPTPDDPGTGFTVEIDYGLELVLKPGRPNDAISPGFFMPMTLPNPDGSPSTGAAEYRRKIEECVQTTIQIGDEIPNEPGNMIGPTRQGVLALIDQDPGAWWDPTANDNKGAVSGGCMAEGTCTMSPRMVALPVVDTDYFEEGRQTGRVDLRIVNILGFFLDGMQGNDVRGYLTHYPGLLVAGSEPVTDEAAFARVILLIR